MYQGNAGVGVYQLCVPSAFSYRASVHGFSLTAVGDLFDLTAVGDLFDLTAVGDLFDLTDHRGM